jgi:hypothetical protein
VTKPQTKVRSLNNFDSLVSSDKLTLISRDDEPTDADDKTPLEVRQLNKDFQDCVIQ